MSDQEIIYKKYSKKIYNLAYRMTGATEDAHDITQDTFLQAFKSLDQFKGESDIYTWLYTIAKNNCLRYLEKKKKTMFLSLQELINKAGSPVSPEIQEHEKVQYISQVKDGCLTGLLRCLSLQQRLVFILHILLEIPVGEVARIIDKSENATRILIHRSKQNIKEFLCENCSLYDNKNYCKCENLINFSLKQNWIHIGNSTPHIAQIESEIKDLKNVVGLYQTLQDVSPSGDLEHIIRQVIVDKKEYLVFNDKKVK